MLSVLVALDAMGLNELLQSIAILIILIIR